MDRLLKDSWHQSQRGYFAGSLYNVMLYNPNVWLLLGDLGYGMFDKIRESFPERVLNCGAAEQSMLGMAVGLAQEGKIPFVYSITSFLLYRGFETLRTYINYEGIPVKLIGSGRNRDYEIDGVSHWSEDARLLLSVLGGINTYWPKDKEEVPELVEKITVSGFPDFLSLVR